jgi:proteasome lid subunit RPN8/RPN11
MGKPASIVPDVSATFETSLLSKVASLARQAGSVETGGILIGEYLDGGRTVRITEATAMPEDSSFGRFWFKRGRKGLDTLLRDRWALGRYYVGEWHSHPGGSAEPSGSDIAAMRQIASDPMYRCEAPLLLVIASGPSDGFSVSLTVFISGSPHRLRHGTPSLILPGSSHQF